MRVVPFVELIFKGHCAHRNLWPLRSTTSRRTSLHYWATFVCMGRSSAEYVFLFTDLYGNDFRVTLKSITGLNYRMLYLILPYSLQFCIYFTAITWCLVRLPFGCFSSKSVVCFYQCQIALKPSWYSCILYPGHSWTRCYFYMEIGSI